MADHKILLEEYKTLRDEILQKQTIPVNYFTISISISALIFGYALKEGNGIAMLVPLVILVPAIYLIFYQFEHLTRISAYIRCFIEEEVDDLNWSTRWHYILQNGLWKHPKLKIKIGVVEGILITIHTIQCLSLIASFLLIENPEHKLIPIFLFPFILLHIYHSITFAKTTLDYAHHFDTWQMVKKMTTQGKG